MLVSAAGINVHDQNKIWHNSFERIMNLKERYDEHI